MLIRGRITSGVSNKEDCKAAKKKFKNCAKLLKNNPSNEEIQKSFWSERRAYKALIRKKKRASVASLHKELREFKSNNPREFWRLINKISDQSGGEEIPISVDVSGEYFKSLLDDKSEDSDINPSHTQSLFWMNLLTIWKSEPP